MILIYNNPCLSVTLHVPVRILNALQWRHMSVTASRTIGNLHVSSTVCSADEQQRKHQSSTSHDIWEGNSPMYVDSTHKGPAIRSIVLSNLSFIDTWSCCDTNRSHITSSTISKCIYWFFSNIDFQLRLFTHWGRDKTAAISKTTFSNVFSWMKIYEFRSRFHWSLFLRFELTISQHWFR